MSILSNHPVIYRLPDEEPIYLKVKTTNTKPKYLLKLGYSELSCHYDSVNVHDIETGGRNPNEIASVVFKYDNKIKSADEMIQKKSINRDCAEIFELFTIFNIPFDSILTTHFESTIMASKLSGKTNQYKNISSIDKNSSADKSTKTVYVKLSNTDFDNVTYLRYASKFLENIFDKIEIGANLFLQFFHIMDESIASFAGLLSSYFTETYIIKPLCSPDTSSSKFLFMKSKKTKSNICGILKEIGTVKNFVLNCGYDISDNLFHVLQCANSQLIPYCYNSNSVLHCYIVSNSCDKAHLENLDEQQLKNFDKWYNKLLNQGDIILKDSLTACNTICDLFAH